VASTSTADLRRQFRNALRDPDVKGGMMLIDSPGGTVAGTDELASDIKAFAKQKPLHAHGEGVIASAAYWLAVQASRVSATRLTDVGSIGVVASVYDESGMYEAAGIKVHVISTGPDKGAFIPGTEVTGEQLEMIQSEVDDIFATFKAEVRKGRSMSDAQFGKVSSGRTWVGTKAVELGLIDAVEGVDDAYTNLARAIRQRKTEDNRRAETIKNIKANM
jgi:signal peptide peptidase SppA